MRTPRTATVITETTPQDALHAAAGLLDELESAAAPILLHGEDTAAWPILRAAASRRLDARIGLEDVLPPPRRRPAPGNAALIRAARETIRHAPQGTQ